MIERIKLAIGAFFNLRVRLWAFLLACLICAGAAGGFVFFREREKIGGKDNYSEAIKYLEVKNAITANYVGEMDASKVADSAYYAMVKSLGDQWSYYMSPSEYKAYEMYTANQYAGIGVTIKLDENTKGYIITGVTAGSPAEKAGVQPAEIILEVGGTSVIGLATNEVRKLITEHLNEVITVKLKRLDGTEQNVKIDCKIIYTNSVSHDLINKNVGYVKITNFESGAAKAAIKAIDELLAKGASTLVFDVRSNPGGLLSELVTLLDYILPEGDIFVSVTKDGKEKVTKSDNVCIKVPMAVIVNENSYSAAEFFAAALSEYGWASVVGEKTTGKGRSQITVKLSDGSAVHISNNKYLTPKRVDLSAQGGLNPDVVVAMTDKKDAQLDAAVSNVLLKLAS